ncbi:proline-rich protein HaeIII subfamily 1-like [Lemur catta]|uniref:proline-rich protein HaeIII subfamily 1-like n=1 Tax=Lemur catta TaxID=9447 RepID=UPI001E26C52E|nr:proline-rich protein HaeIII subfamily 1-like [Lemur catta]
MALPHPAQREGLDPGPPAVREQRWERVPGARGGRNQEPRAPLGLPTWGSQRSRGPSRRTRLPPCRSVLRPKTGWKRSAAQRPVPCVPPDPSPGPPSLARQTGALPEAAAPAAPAPEPAPSKLWDPVFKALTLTDGHASQPAREALQAVQWAHWTLSEDGLRCQDVRAANI